MGVKKYFIAIVIPEPLLGEIEGIKQGLYERHGLKGALRSPAHITLHRPFEWKEEKEAVLLEVLHSFRFDKSFVVKLGNFAWFEPRVIYVDVAPNEILFELQAALKKTAARELKLLNEVNDRRGFHPHVTVAFRDLKKPKFYELRTDFETRQLNGTFDYRGFSLLKLAERWEEHAFFDAGK